MWRGSAREERGGTRCRPDPGEERKEPRSEPSAFLGRLADRATLPFHHDVQSIQTKPKAPPPPEPRTKGSFSLPVVASCLTNSSLTCSGSAVLRGSRPPPNPVTSQHPDCLRAVFKSNRLDDAQAQRCSKRRLRPLGAGGTPFGRLL